MSEAVERETWSERHPGTGCIVFLVMGGSCLEWPVPPIMTAVGGFFMFLGNGGVQ